ncbi:hypothetical protein VMCG_08875 [Cytospora schulzeri]|uniref:Uncharacterized protein n=1 Tax=Cytospora schulzeri TaxID=448051 RepID=A0A423VUX4_9PEZI|nr:hypothetical protein VMCG_08875 [Valsa malicola]
MEPAGPHSSWRPGLDVHNGPQTEIKDNNTGRLGEQQSKQPEDPKPELSSWYRKPDPHHQLRDLENHQPLPRENTELGLGEDVVVKRRRSSCCCSRATIFIIAFFIIVVVAAIVAGGVAGSQAWRR